MRAVERVAVGVGFCSRCRRMRRVPCLCLSLGFQVFRRFSSLRLPAALTAERRAQQTETTGRTPEAAHSLHDA